MTNVKDWAKKHKKDIAIVVGAVLIGGVSYTLGNYGSLNPKQISRAKEFADLTVMAVDGGKAYVPITAEEFAKLAGRNTILCGMDNTETLKVTGGLIFGNKVDI